MSNEVRQTQEAKYEHFGESFYRVWGDDPEVMARAQEINDIYNDYLYAFDVNFPWQLPRELQEYLSENSKIAISFGEDDE